VALNLVNTVPGKSTESISPGGPFHLGFRGPVLLSTVNVALGVTDLRHHQELPEDDAKLPEVAFRSVERLQPESGSISVGLSQGNLVLSRSSSSQFQKSTYEVRVPIDMNASILGYAKVRRGNWALKDSPDWCPLTGMVGLYFGLRHGQYNTGCYTFLRQKPVSGQQVIISGPLQAFQQARPNQHGVDLDWASVPVGEDIEFWIFINNDGYELPFDPPHVPSYDVWVSSPTLGMVHVDRGHLMHMGQDPKKAQETYATLFFGNAGQAGDVFEFIDWGIFQSFSVAIENGSPRAGHEITVRASSPVTYRAEDGRQPDALRAGRWFYPSDAGVLPRKVAFGFQPGRKSFPQSVILSKDVKLGHSAFERDEPQLNERQTGFMVEGFISATPKGYDGDAFGAGLEVDDGAYSFRILMLNTVDGRALGVPYAGLPPSHAVNYALIEGVDFTSFKLIRMTYDRPRGRLLVDVEGVRSLDLLVPQDIALPTSNVAGKGRVRFGHLIDVNSGGDFAASFVNFMSEYLAYEAADGVLPPAAAVPFTQYVVGAGTFSLVDGAVLIEKPEYAAPLTYAMYRRNHPVDAWRGAFLEFTSKVSFYTDQFGTSLPKNTFTGVAVTLHMGSQRLQLGFYDAGAHGRLIGILSKDGTHEDIINQTDLGRRFSFRTDWLDEHTYRVHYKPYDRIEIWVDTVVGPPALIIPWESEDMLAADTGVPTGVSFGHVSENQSSRSQWKSVRYGITTGFDVGVQKVYEGEPSDAQFGGKAMFIAQVGDGI
jgi:hypothetical protein